MYDFYRLYAKSAEGFVYTFDCEKNREEFLECNEGSEVVSRSEAQKLSNMFKELIVW